MGLRKDIWRPAIVNAPIERIVERGGIDGLDLHWLPTAGSFQFLADPFGLWRDDVLHVFVETYDYRDRIGSIELLRYDRAFNLLDRGPVLAEPWHLSYPQIIEADGEIWMLPEAHRSGRLTLFRANPFPWVWERAGEIALGQRVVDATPLFHAGQWWLFYAPATKSERMTALHVAYADQLKGPWTPHPLNPVRRDLASTRPGGTAYIGGDGAIVLPTQDCTGGYGSAVRPLRITRLSHDAFEADARPAIRSPASTAPFTAGLHTLSAAGAVTLVDMKRTQLTLKGIGIEAAYQLKTLIRGRRR